MFSKHSVEVGKNRVFMKDKFAQIMKEKKLLTAESKEDFLRLASEKVCFIEVVTKNRANVKILTS